MRTLLWRRRPGEAEEDGAVPEASLPVDDPVAEAPASFAEPVVEGGLDDGLDDGLAEATDGETEAEADRLPHRPWYRSGTIPWALFVMALAAAVIFGSLWQRAQVQDHRRTEIINVSDRFLQALTNFKATTIQADVARIRTFAVGDFADQVDQFFGPSTTSSITKAGVVSVGHVRSVFVQTMNGTTATILGVVNESVTNQVTKSPRTEVLRLVAELIQTRSGWKVDKVDVLQSPDQTSPFGS